MTYSNLISITDIDEFGELKSTIIGPQTLDAVMSNKQCLSTKLMILFGRNHVPFIDRDYKIISIKNKMGRYPI